MKVLVSACLLGEPVRYDGGARPCHHPTLTEWRALGQIVPICPEVEGGLPIPRPPAEIQGGDGDDVLTGAAQVCTRDGHDVTQAFLLGAEAALLRAQTAGAALAILKANSPSCGSHCIYDGSFGGRLASGRGVTSALLQAYGIRVFDETEIDAAASYLASREATR